MELEPTSFMKSPWFPARSIFLSRPLLPAFYFLSRIYMSVLLPLLEYKILQDRDLILKLYFGGFPGGAVVKNPSANAGDTGSSPGLGRSHMPRSNWAREPQLLSLRVWSLCSATREATRVRGPCTTMKSGPRSPQLERALAQKRRPNTAKKNK